MKNKKLLIFIIPVLIVLFVVSRFLIYNARKKPYEKINMALVDYYKIASIDWYLNIDKNEGKTKTMYQYNIKQASLNYSVELTSRELTLFYNGYIRQKELIAFDYQKYNFYNFPEEIMDYVCSNDEFYHPKNSKILYNDLKDSKESLNTYKWDQYKQLSISFDKDYSIDEAKELLKEQEGVIWLWVDTYKDKDISKKVQFLTGECHEWVGLAGKEKRRVIDPSIAQVFGIKMIDEENKPIDKPEEVFIDILNKNNNPEGNKVVEKIYEVKQSIKKEGTVKKEDIRILGCVVMCDKDNLWKLNNKSFIRGIYLYTNIIEPKS